MASMSGPCASDWKRKSPAAGWYSFGMLAVFVGAGQPVSARQARSESARSIAGY